MMPMLVHITAADEVFTKKKLVLQFTVLENTGTAETPEWTAKDITGMSLRWVMGKKGRLPATLPLLDCSTAADEGITITNGAGGVCQVVVEKEDMDIAASLKDYAHELSETTAGTVLAYGDFCLLQSPT